MKNAVLWSGFFVLLVISIVTVMMPELSDDGAEDEADAQGQTDEEASPSSDPASAGASPSPSAPATP